MSKQELVQNLIDYASGTESYHRFSILPNAPVITDGVKAVADAAGCYWLLDIIASYQGKKELGDFQVWELTLNATGSGAVVVGYNDDTPVVRQIIKYTDFPLQKITIWCIDGVILLPNEY